MTGVIDLPKDCDKEVSEGSLLFVAENFEIARRFWKGCIVGELVMMEMVDIAMIADCECTKLSLIGTDSWVDKVKEKYKSKVSDSISVEV